jgi:DNA-binding transcriptional ArsR family regulator
MTADKDPTNRQAILDALQHPLRRELLKLLIDQREITPVEASRRLEETISNVSYHLRKLADGGAVNLDRMGQARGAAVHFYVPDPAVEQLPWVREAIGLPASRQI